MNTHPHAAPPSASVSGGASSPRSAAPIQTAPGTAQTLPVVDLPAGRAASPGFSGDRLAYIAAIKPTQTDMLRVIRWLEQHCKPWLPGELDALKRRANAIGGAGLRDVLRAIEGAKG